MRPSAPPIPPRLHARGPAVWHLAPEGPWAPADGPRVLVGGVGYWWQRDASLGLFVVEALGEEAWRPGVRVEKLDYGAVHVAEDLRNVSPPYDRIVLVCGAARGHTPGHITERRWDGALPDDAAIQTRIYEAGAGVVDLDHLLIIAGRFGVLPPDVRLIEVEPVDTAPGTELSPSIAALLPGLLARVRRAVAAPLPTSIAPASC